LPLLSDNQRVSHDTDGYSSTARIAQGNCDTIKSCGFSDHTSVNSEGRLAPGGWFAPALTGTAVRTYSDRHDEPVDGKDVTAVVAALNRNDQNS